MPSGPYFLMYFGEKTKKKTWNSPQMLMIALLAFIIVLLITGSSHASEGYVEIKAEEILNKIEMGEPVEYDHVLVQGDLNLSSLNLSKIGGTQGSITAPVEIKQSIINGSVDFEGIIFSKPSTFESTIFSGDASFARTDFQDSVSFENARFGRAADFDEAKFEGDANYNKAEFVGVSSFYLADFKGDANFYTTTFDTDANFNKAAFDGDAFFDGAQFATYANFENAKFEGEASFYQAKFNWNTNFANAKFDGMTYFSDALLREESGFESIQSNRYLSFEGTQFGGDADFKSAQFSGYISFLGANFNSMLTLNDTQFSSLQVGWDAIKDHLVYNEAVYVALIKNFESLGYFRDADNCYYQYRLYNQAQETSLGTKAIDVLAWISCGYGVRPTYTLVLSLVIIFLFGVVYWACKAIPERAHLGSRLAETLQISQLTNSLYFSALAFVTPHASVEWRPSGHWKYLVLSEHIIGWLLMALFLVTLGRVMIR